MLSVTGSRDSGKAGGTIFAAIDLSAAKGLETVVHRKPSTIGIDTIYKSRGRIPEVFLRGCGVPDDFIAYIGSMDWRCCVLGKFESDGPSGMGVWVNVDFVQKIEIPQTPQLRHGKSMCHCVSSSGEILPTFRGAKAPPELVLFRAIQSSALLRTLT